MGHRCLQSSQWHVWFGYLGCANQRPVGQGRHGHQTHLYKIDNGTLTFGSGIRPSWLHKIHDQMSSYRVESVSVSAIRLLR
ncbi:MAG: hypothetical protein Udaeo2_20680 [Candidatus Udaeobacter sp.]|nr:MAG: hypothetical protein Udaeo2_20680 [Candidatus Udaeobacter sp.]